MNHQPRFRFSTVCRALAILALPATILLDCASGQVIPATPKKFTKRDIGDSGKATVDVQPAPDPPRKIREVTYVVLSPQRQFTSTDGKNLLGKLIAFDQKVVERTEQQSNNSNPAAETTTTTPPSNKPTVVKDGKVRLLVNSKVFELPLTRLSTEDRKFIEDLRQKVEAKPADP
jgi:hypothetical protein